MDNYTMNIEWSKYKRFFSFGCSFTRYMWPTWADIISKQVSQAEFFNFGMSGAGNLQISARVAEANSRFKFTDTDLVMVMFSSYCREDRWVETKWLSQGNVYVNGIYPPDWVRKFADERGYLIRDAALIDLTVKYVEALPCTFIPMLSVPFVIGSENCDYTSKQPVDIVSVYGDTFSKFKQSMHESVMVCWVTDYTGFKDGHPSPIKYHNYLQNIGLDLSLSTTQYAKDATQILLDCKNKNLLPSMFPEQDENIAKADRLLF